MNKKIDFQQTGGFPLDTDVLEFMQESYALLHALGELAGNLSILRGCEVVGNTVTNGIVYIDGVIMPFKGGTASENVSVRTVETALIFEDGASKTVLFEKQAEFGGVVNVYKWEDFHRVENIKSILEKINTHEHTWRQIKDKPETFPPSEHQHNWNNISNKPSKFNPTAHRHNAADIDGLPVSAGRVVIAGKIRCNPKSVIKKYVGDFSVEDYNNTGWLDHYVIRHNLGHTDYIVTGQCISHPFVKLNCFQINANTCVITTSDDNSGNATDIDFMITSFK